jgi:single-strand DNA-binding protein
MSFAKVAIVGNLGRDPETRYTPSGALNVQFTIAASGRRRGGEQGEQDNTTWFRVTAWDRLAERLVNMTERGYIGKGKLLYVEGQLESRQFTGNDGQVRTSLEVTMSDFQFVGSRQDNQGGQAGGQGGNFGGGQGGQDAGFSGGQGGYGGGGYGGSNYGNQGGFDNDDEPGNLNDVPF